MRSESEFWRLQLKSSFQVQQQQEGWVGGGEASSVISMGEEVVESQPEVSIPNEVEEYSWPVLRFDVSPHRTYHFHQQFTSPTNPNNFLKAVKWSPDGSSFLTSSDDNSLRLFTLYVNLLHCLFSF